MLHYIPATSIQHVGTVADLLCRHKTLNYNGGACARPPEWIPLAPWANACQIVREHAYILSCHVYRLYGQDSP